jgi:hypothetical protein
MVDVISVVEHGFIQLIQYVVSNKTKNVEGALSARNQSGTCLGLSYNMRSIQRYNYYSARMEEPKRTVHKFKFQTGSNQR